MESFWKLTQKFGTEESNSEKSSSLIKNAYITIQGDYTSNFYQTYDENHKYNLFDYGHVGNFVTHKAPVYGNDTAIRFYYRYYLFGTNFIRMERHYMNLILLLIIQIRKLYQCLL